LLPAVLRRLFVPEDDRKLAPRRSGIRLRVPKEGNDDGAPEFTTVDLLNPPWNEGLGLFDFPERVLDEVSTMIGKGNLRVFAELGPIFARMLDLYRDGPPSECKLAELLEPILPGPTADGGQGLLRSALTHYHNAMLTNDPDRRAELILFGNARIGLHEQIRLQAFIAGALNAPIRCLRNTVEDTVGGPTGLLSGVLDSMKGIVRPAVYKLNHIWRELATKEMMRLRLPNEVLDLGDDLPPLPGQPLYPQYLCTIEDPELYDVLREYSAHDSTSRGSGARDWAYLPERMGYILELFRSRQCYPRLMEPPFSEAQYEELSAGRVPTTRPL
jgi:hypothetical protein